MSVFETMGSFYWFFFPTLAAIIVGIIFEEKLVRFENRICRFIKRAFTRGKTKNHSASI